MTTPSPRRRIVHIVTQAALLALAAVNLFFVGVAISNAGWLSLLFLVAAAAIVFGVAIEQTRWLVLGAALSVVGSVIAIRLRTPVDDHQPTTTGVISAVLIVVWWVSRPQFGRRLPFSQK